MKPETEQALRDSIAHWKRMRDDVMCGESHYTAGCSLCTRFWPHVGLGVDDGANRPEPCQRLDGERCPVFHASGYPRCEVTPWDAASAARHRAISRHRYPLPSDPQTSEALALANWHAEADRFIVFLESLLPPAPPENGGSPA